MYIVTGEKSYLLTDYCPSRKYAVVRFTNGNGEQWCQLGYKWLFRTFYLQSLRETDYGTYGDPLEFDTAEHAAAHLDRERTWADNAHRENTITVEKVADLENRNGRRN